MTERSAMNLPPVFSEEEWQAAREALLVKEKEATRARDALAAERRRLPMVRIDKDYVFDGPDGNATLLDLFEGRRQLLLYHFMFGPNQDAGCDGCSMFVPEAPRESMSARAAALSSLPIATFSRPDEPAETATVVPLVASPAFGLAVPGGDRRSLTDLWVEGSDRDAAAGSGLHVEGC
jgi:hypothetical protein